MIALLDTHVFLWWFEQPKRLSVAQRRIIRRNDERHPLGVSDASLWEIALLIEAGRVRLELPIEDWLSRATAAPRVVVCPVTPSIAREIIAAAMHGWDPADRIIVGTARTLGVPLVTADERIIDSGLVRTIH
ncbi:MAG: type II toxin-antitoxin system VapC family toxin [Polyangiaceae bacterium]|nr:type II toxin-antitoxin system VapC family toxin [Polyangiaceae bacterium]